MIARTCTCTMNTDIRPMCTNTMNICMKILVPADVTADTNTNKTDTENPMHRHRVLYFDKIARICYTIKRTKL